MKKNHLRLVKHMATNIVLLLAAMVVLLIAAAHRNYTRQMERLDVYIGVLSGRTAQHAGDVFQDKLSAITSAACLYGEALGEDVPHRRERLRHPDLRRGRSRGRVL